MAGTVDALAVAEARQARILDALPDMLFWLTGDGEVLDFRVPDSHLLVPRDQVKGWRVTQPPMPHRAGQQWLLAVRRCIAQRTSQSVRYELPLPGGARQQEVRFAWLGGERVLAMARDLTSDERRAESTHVSTVQQHERVLASLNDFVWSVRLDSRGQFHPEYVSPVVERVLGRPPEYFLEAGDNYLKIVHPADVPLLLANAESMLNGERSEVEFSYRIRLPSREERWISDRVCAERLADGVRLTGVGSDITEARRVEERLRESQKLEELGSLAGGIAHDFNNLLVGMLGGAEVALEALPKDSPALRPLEGIRDSATRAAELCRQMLAYAGKGALRAENVDLCLLVSGMGSLLRSPVGRKLELRIELPDGPCPVWADASQLRQLVLNLLNNAVDAMGSSGGEVRVCVEPCQLRQADLEAARLGEPCREGAYVMLSVSDDGIGMDTETVRRMFQPFFTTKPQGRGLGMAAVSGIVRAHGGALWVHSTPGEGSRIEVALPLLESEIETAPTEIEGAPTRVEGRRVLVIDDEDTVLMVAGAVLETAGYEVLSASSGPAGLEMLRQHAGGVAAVVLDMTMPGMGGAEVLRRLREIEPALPVIVSSGYSEEDARGELSGQRHLSFLAKPYRANQLRDAVAQATS